METFNVKRYLSNGGTALEIGDFYQGEAVITAMEETGTNLKIYTFSEFGAVTSTDSFDITLKPGDYLVLTDGSSKLVKSKFDKDDSE